MASKAHILDQLDRLQHTLDAAPGGLLAEEAGARSGLGLDRRTLQRRLDALVVRGTVRRVGKGRATRYLPHGTLLPTPLPTTPPPTVGPPALAETVVPLSTAGADLRASVGRPPAARTPVAYRRAFLDTYRPNVTAYLAPADRLRLANLSRTVETGNEPAGTHAQRILARLLIDLSWNSSRLEGNTYSLLDTQRLIEAGEIAEGRAAAETQMILNHKAAIEFLVQSADRIAVDRSTVLNLHALLAENLLPDPTAVGRIRRIPVAIGQSVYHPPEMPQLLEECFDQILGTAARIEDPFEQAFFLMVHLPYLQPFEDVNKRVSRLAANIPLITRNLSPLSFVDVPADAYTSGMLAVYELNRVELLRDVFLWAYARSAARYAAIRQAIGEPDPFRLRHRTALKEIVSTVVRERLDQRGAARRIAGWAADRVDAADRARFVEVAETELMALHDGNFARYQVTPSQFAAWRAVWRAHRSPP
jgi:fido (protein-threonine AMPylation protein)